MSALASLTIKFLLIYHRIKIKVDISFFNIVTEDGNF